MIFLFGWTWLSACNIFYPARVIKQIMGVPKKYKYFGELVCHASLWFSICKDTKKWNCFPIEFLKNPSNHEMFVNLFWTDILISKPEPNLILPCKLKFYSKIFKGFETKTTAFEIQMSLVIHNFIHKFKTWK